MNLSQIGLNLAALEQLIADGYITRRVHANGELAIYNYTSKVQYERVWTPETMASRGLITTLDGEIVARPWAKFFNLTERPETEYQNLPTGPIEVTEKVDGSLGVLYKSGGDWAIATRGSFTSVQSQWATEHLRAHYAIGDLPMGLTLLFEILFPDNRIVVDYGDRTDLVLLGARMDTGEDYDYAALQAVAAQWGLLLVPRVEVESLEALAQLATERLGEEGWVVRFANGLRVKVKTAEYVRLHRLLTRVTVRSIWELLAEGQDITALLENVPDEFYAWVRTTVAELQGAFATIEQIATADAASVAAIPTRKEQAAIIARTAYPGIAFRMLDGKNYAELIWRMIKPTALKPFRVDEE